MFFIDQIKTQFFMTLWWFLMGYFKSDATFYDNIYPMVKTEELQSKSRFRFMKSLGFKQNSNIYLIVQRDWIFSRFIFWIFWYFLQELNLLKVFKLLLTFRTDLHKTKIEIVLKIQTDLSNKRFTTVQTFLELIKPDE